MTNPPVIPVFDETAVQRMIDRALEAQAEQHQNEIDTLTKRVEDREATIASLSTTLVPEHAGGVGEEIAPTWSQYEQELARTGVEKE